MSGLNFDVHDTKGLGAYVVPGQFRIHGVVEYRRIAPVTPLGRPEFPFKTILHVRRFYPLLKAAGRTMKSCGIHYVNLIEKGLIRSSLGVCGDPREVR